MIGFCMHYVSILQYIDDSLRATRKVTMTIMLATAMVILLAYFIIKAVSKVAIEKELAVLGGMPFAIDLWDDTYTPVDCNRKTLEMFGLPSKEEYFRRLYELAPETQPCGSSSKEKYMSYMERTMADGHARFEFLHLTTAGEPLPAEISLARFKRQGKYMIAAYTVDLRPIKQETQRMLAEAQRREIAESESQAKTRFLARMSHEIRTPMNAVLGITEIQLQKGTLPPDTEEAFLRIQSSSTLLLTIINDILDLSKVEAGKMEIFPEVYEVASMIVDTVQLNMMHAGSKNIEFKLNVDENLPSRLIGDEFRIKQILNNILSNAFKYTSEGSVALSVSMEGARKTTGSIILVFRVQDSGQGMTEEQISNLDIEFARFNLHSNRIIEGAGLGMPIAYQLASMMEGDIKVDSELGRGSVFTVRIPQKPGGNKLVGKETADNLANFEISQKALKKMTSFERIPMPYGRVMVVDDVDSNLYVVKGLLMPYKISIETAGNGQEAIEKIKAGEVYDIVFMDHMMPGIDGIEATRVIRQMGYERPIIALTANALKDVPELFLNNGFSGFLSKPININQLNSYLIRYIHDKQPRETIEAAKSSAAAESAGILPDSLRESFLLDARRAIDILGPLTESVIQGREPGKKGLKSFAIQAHAMKSALHNIGEARLSKTAFMLETAGQAADVETIRASAPCFLDNLTELIAELSPKGTCQEAGDEEDVDFLKAQFDIIAHACRQLDLNAANSALEKLSGKQCSKKIKELIKDISTNLLYSNFDEAIALANRAASTI